MSKKLLSEEEINILRASPYVAQVSKRIVVFTPEFKQIAYDELCQGKKMNEILETRSIKPKMLGEIRVRGIQQKIEKQADREEGFRDLRSENRRRPSKKEATEHERIAQLEHELAYTRQEVEFLKKLSMANTEAQRKWESKQRQK